MEQFGLMLKKILVQVVRGQQQIINQIVNS